MSGRFFKKFSTKKQLSRPHRNRRALQCFWFWVPVNFTWTFMLAGYRRVGEKAENIAHSWILNSFIKKNSNLKKNWTSGSFSPLSTPTFLHYLIPLPSTNDCQNFRERIISSMNNLKKNLETFEFWIEHDNFFFLFSSFFTFSTFFCIVCTWPCVPWTLTWTRKLPVSVQTAYRSELKIIMKNNNKNP